MPLKSITRFPPGGFTYVQPETRMEFKQIIPITDQALLVSDHRKSNAISRSTVEESMQDIEDWTCLRLNYDPEWCIVDDKKKTAVLRRFGSQLEQAVQAVAESVESAVAGARIIYEWWGDGGVPVEPKTSQKRADVCISCPKNSTDKTWLSSLSEAATKQLQLRSRLKMSVDGDEKLGTCTVCQCPMKLKVHTPLELIREYTPSSIMDDLEKVSGPCWVRDEIKGKKTT